MTSDNRLALEIAERRAFAAKLKSWRQAHNMTQAQAASVFEVGLTTYRQWEYQSCLPMHPERVLEKVA